MKIKKGDTVKMLSGKDRGKTGKVLATFPAKGKLLIENINLVKKHKRQTGQKDSPGGIIEMEAPVYTSKVMLVCPLCSKAARVGYVLKDNKKVRICKKCKKVIHNNE